MGKQLSPWDQNFATENTVIKVLPDEIEHYGNANSGRYRRGSGKQHLTSSQKKEARNIRKNAKKIRKNWKKAYKGNDVKQAKKMAKAMREAGLIKRKAAKAMILKAKVDAAQLKRLKPEMKQLKNIIKTSKTSLEEAKKMYNTPAIKTVETLYLTKPKKIDISQAASEENSVIDLYSSLSDDQKAVSMFVASMVCDSEDEEDDGLAQGLEHGSSGELDVVYETMSNEQKAVIPYLISLMLIDKEGEESMIADTTIKQGPSPWSEEFYTANTIVKKTQDEIQHYGVKGMKWAEKQIQKIKDKKTDDAMMKAYQQAAATGRWDLLTPEQQMYLKNEVNQGRVLKNANGETEYIHLPEKFIDDSPEGKRKRKYATVTGSSAGKKAKANFNGATTGGSVKPAEKKKRGQTDRI